MLDPRLIAKADARQLLLPKAELSRLAIRVQEDFRNALADHDGRMRRFTRYYRRWRGRTEVPELGAEGPPNFQVPLTQWQVFSKWAKEHAALFGDDAALIDYAVTRCRMKQGGDEWRKTLPQFARFHGAMRAAATMARLLARGGSIPWPPRPPWWPPGAACSPSARPTPTTSRF